MSLTRKLAAEFLGTAGLLMVVVGSGIMGERLADGNAAVALLANSVATGAGMIVLIYSLENISGAHFNPAVTITATVNRNIGAGLGFAYLVTQFLGAGVGVVVANLMFELPTINLSTKVRAGSGQFVGEFVATFGLIGVIAVFSRFNPRLTGAMVACYITAAYWFTSSTSFANPAVTAARTLSNTFAGIAPVSVPIFILAQLIGAFAALLFFRWLINTEKDND